MLRLIWFVFKIGLVTAGAMWLAYRPGSVDITWDLYGTTYEINIQFGFFLLILFLAILLSVGLTRFMLYFKTLFLGYKDRKTLADVKKGLNSLTLSLSSAAAGDDGYAAYHAKRAHQLLPGDQPLPILLEANALKRTDKKEQANQMLEELLSDKEGAVLAARALVNNALQEDNIFMALHHARTAYTQYKGRDDGWLLKTLYELEVRHENWNEAETLLKKAEKKKAITKEKAQSDLIAIITAHAKEAQVQGEFDRASKLYRKALKANSGFIPAALSLSDLYLEQGYKRKALKVIEKCWIKAPHPDLALTWARIGLISQKDYNELSWMQKLASKNPDHLESMLIKIKAMMSIQTWDDARDLLEQAVIISSERRVFKLWADLEELSGKSEASVRHRMEQMIDAKSPPEWICNQTGRIYEEWFPIAEPHGSFNTIIWDYAENIVINDNWRGELSSSSFDLLTASS